MIAGPSAASSMLELAPTTAVSMTLITSEERSADSVGSVKRSSSMLVGPSDGQVMSSESGMPVAASWQPGCLASGAATRSAGRWPP